MNTIKHIDDWFKQALPKPTFNNQVIQCGVHLEEVAEMLETITECSDSAVYKDAIDNAYKSIHELAECMKKDKTFTLNVNDRQELLDALCDQIVTAIGTAHTQGFDLLGALQEVSDSNWSKFVNGVPQFDMNGKISKGPNYFRPKLTKYVGKDPVDTPSM